MRLAGDRLVAVHVQSKRASVLLAKQQKALVNSPLVAEAAEAMLIIDDFRLIGDDPAAALGIAGASLRIPTTHVGSAARLDRVLQELRLLQREVEEKTVELAQSGEVGGIGGGSREWKRFSVAQLRREIASTRQLIAFEEVDAPQRVARTTQSIIEFGMDPARFTNALPAHVKLVEELKTEEQECLVAEKEAQVRDVMLFFMV